MLNRLSRVLVGLLSAICIIPLLFVSLIGWVITDKFLIAYLMNWIFSNECNDD